MKITPPSGLPRVSSFSRKPSFSRKRSGGGRKSPAPDEARDDVSKEAAAPRKAGAEAREGGDPPRAARKMLLPPRAPNARDAHRAVAAVARDGDKATPAPTQAHEAVPAHKASSCQQTATKTSAPSGLQRVSSGLSRVSSFSRKASFSRKRDSNRKAPAAPAQAPPPAPAFAAQAEAQAKASTGGGDDGAAFAAQAQAQAQTHADYFDDQEELKQKWRAVSDVSGVVIEELHEFVDNYDASKTDGRGGKTARAGANSGKERRRRADEARGEDGRPARGSQGSGAAAQTIERLLGFALCCK